MPFFKNRLRIIICKNFYHMASSQNHRLDKIQRFKNITCSTSILVPKRLYKRHISVNLKTSTTTLFCGPIPPGFDFNTSSFHGSHSLSPSDLPYIKQTGLLSLDNDPKHFLVFVPSSNNCKNLFASSSSIITVRSMLSSAIYRSALSRKFRRFWPHCSEFSQNYTLPSYRDPSAVCCENKIIRPWPAGAVSVCSYPVTKNILLQSIVPSPAVALSPIFLFRIYPIQYIAYLLPLLSVSPSPNKTAIIFTNCLLAVTITAITARFSFSMRPVILF